MMRRLLPLLPLHSRAPLGLVVAIGLALSPGATAQAAADRAPTKAVYTPTSLEADPGLPRTAAGRPDFQGEVWTTNFFPVFEANPMSDRLVVSEEKAAEMVKMFVAGFLSSDDDNIKIDAEAHSLIGGTDGLPIVRGERRARLVVLPADGKLPLTKAAREELSTTDPMDGPKDDPEQRPAAERCLNRTPAPPSASTLGLNFIRFIQTGQNVVIHEELGDVIRVIPIADGDEPHSAGDAVGGAIGYWDGDTLVIETNGGPADARVRILPSIIVQPESKVIERYTRLSRDELLYQYTVVDPEIYTQPWLAEHSLYRTDMRMYPHACHEGNYSLENILKGARQADLRAGE